MKPSRIIISGGGTGGHLFPAIAIAQAIRQKEKEAEILFVGAKGKIEEKKVPEAGFEIELLDIAGFQRKLSFKTITFFFKLFKSLVKSTKILKKFKPDIAIGVGGYASGPLLYRATKIKIPTLLQEQNSYPGITNKILAKHVAKICVAYDNLERFFPAQKIIKTGNPVRENILTKDIKKEEAVKFFGLNPNKKIILSVGGSGGAFTINQSIKEHLHTIIENDFQLIWQTGAYYYDSLKNTTQQENAKNIKITAFITRMDLAFAAADIVITRAGAGTISELCLLSKASILVPSPNVAEDHQTKNAEALTKNNAAILVTDKNAKTDLIDTAISLLKDTKRCTLLSENISKHGVQNSAQKIANEVFKLINIKTSE